jgi:uncharacterized protein (DUF2249 family)
VGTVILHRENRIAVGEHGDAATLTGDHDYAPLLQRLVVCNTDGGFGS